MNQTDQNNLGFHTDNSLNDFFRIYKDYLEGSHSKPVWQSFDKHKMYTDLSQYFSKDGYGTQQLLYLLEEKIIPYSMNLLNPMYMGHQVPPSLPIAVMMDMITSGINQSLPVSRMSPVLSVVEKVLIDYLKLKLGFGETSNGTITSGGSVSNLLGLLGARVKYFQDNLPDDAVILCSKETHYSIKKAARILGIKDSNIQFIPCNKQYQLDYTKIPQIIKQLKQNNMIPFIICATSGTTSTGSFDNLKQIGAIAKQHNLWLHVDGAHGCSLILSDKYKKLIEGISEADSLSWDGHKMMFMPSSLGISIFKEDKNLRSIFSDQKAPYMFNNSDDSLDLGKLSIQCTRKGDALKLWGSFVAYGTDYFEERIDYLGEITEYFYNRLLETPLFQTIHKPQFNIITYRYIPDNSKFTEEDINKLNSEIRDAVNDSGKTMLTLTVVDGKVCLRNTIINPATTTKNINEIIHLIQECGSMLAN